MLQAAHTVDWIGPIEVDNPLVSPSAPVAHRTIVAARSLRDDQLALLHHRRQISDAEYQAGRWFQAIHEAGQVGAIPAQDPSREPVDGGRRVPDPFTDRQLVAMRQLDRVYAMLGREGKAIVLLVLVEQASYAMVAHRLYASTSRATLRYVGRRFRESLGNMSTDFGFAPGS